MKLANLITIDRVACDVDTASKKRALEHLSHLISNNSPELNPNEVFESLVARERLGSTGLGKGIAIPHGRLKSGNKTIAAFIQLVNGVDFDAPDGEPVDLLCALLVPPECSDEHLEVLALLSEMFRNPELRDRLRNTHSPAEIYDLLANWSSSHGESND